MEEIIDRIKAEHFKEGLKKGQDIQIKVWGYCMRPFIKNGEDVIVRSILFEDILIGDLILTYKNNKFFCHRVFKKTGHAIQTKADALVGLDAEVGGSGILGKVIAKKVRGRIKNIDRWRHRLAGYCIVHITGVIVRAYPFLRSMKKSITKKISKSRMAQVSIQDNESLSDRLILDLVRYKAQDIEPVNFTDQQWQKFLDKVYAEGVSGYIYARLKNNQPLQILPQWVLERLEDEYFTNIGRNMLLKGEFDQVVKGLEENHCEALVVRGAIFINQLYTDLGVRPLIDMDIVIHREDLSKAQDILKKQGYQYHENYPYFVFKDNIYVDLHLDSINFWRIKGWPSAININNKDLMKETSAVEGASTVKSLSTYDSILHCCEHLMRHSFDRLIWFMDIVELVKKEGGNCDWNILIDRARAFNIQKSVYYIFSYLEKTGLISMPQEKLSQLGNFSMNTFEKKNLKLLLANQRRNISGDVLSLLAIPGLKRRVEVLWNGVFIKKENFPLVREPVTPLSYLKRFVKLVNYVLRKAL